MLRVYLFGRFRIESDEARVRLSTRKVRLLTAYLLLNPGPHSREKLAALFWPDVSDRAARASLRNALSSLRRQLDHEMLLADRERVRINPAYPVWVDALAFQSQASTFIKTPAPEMGAIDVDLYAGPLLAEFYDDWVLVKREELRALYLDALLLLTQQMRAQSEYERAIEFAQRVLAVDRANERAHQHLMFCHVALGDRGTALRQYEICLNALRDELDVEPSPETRRLNEWIQQAPADRLPVEASITNLPIPLTSFVGRQREMASIKTLLSSVRLLTLTGMGGSGKTRVAIRAATDLLDVYRDGVWWVELAALADAELLPRSIAKALGVAEVPNQIISDTVVNFLRSKRLLLVLDNCEHLISATARLVQRLLRECAHLTVLATSREMLGIAGEHVWPVPTLSVPEPQHSLSVDDLVQHEAIRLFIERAAAASPTFTLTDENVPAITEVCWRLEGLPLAIELAAARVNVLAVEQIAARLDNAFQLLAHGSRTALPRHQTLRAAIDWSHDLLTEPERILFRRLSVLAGGWTLRAAEVICAGEGIAEVDVVDLLSDLVDKSLVQAQPRGDEVRFRMLETIRQYSSERLRASGELDTVRDHHLHYFLRLVEASDPYLGYFLADRDMELWLRRLEAEYDNLRAAIRWSVETNSAEAGLRIATLLHWFWVARGQFSEGRAWFNRLLKAANDVSPTTRAQALLTAGYLACWQGDFASGRTPLEQALAMFEQLEDGPATALSLHGLGFAAMGQGDADLSRLRFEQSLRTASAADNKWVMSFAMHFLAIVLTYQRHYATALSYFEEGDVLIQQVDGHKQGLAFSLFHRARIARLLGDHLTAAARHAEGIQLFREIGDRRGIGYSLAGFAVLAAVQGDLQRAARLSGTVATLQAVVGSFLEAPLQIEYDREMEVVQTMLDEEVFANAVDEGQAMALDEAIEYTLEVGYG